MLLVIAVMFTFSFGSAFAAGTPKYTDKDVYLADVAAAEVTATAQLEAQFNVLKATVTAKEAYNVANTGASDNYSVKAEAWEVALSMLYSDMKSAITTTTNALVSANDWNSRETAVTASDYASATAIDGKYDTASNMETLLTTTEAYKYAAAKKQAELDKAKYLAGAAAIDTTVYSTTEGAADAYKLSATKQYNNAKAYAEALIADLTAKMAKDNVNVVYSDTTSAKVADKALAMKALFEDVVSYNSTTKVYSLLESGNYAVYGTTGTDFYAANGSAARLDIKTVKEENLANQSSAYKIQTNVSAAYQTVFAAEYNGETQNADAIAKWQELADAYTAVQTYLAKSTPDAFPAYTITYNKTTKVYTLTESATKYIANAKAVEDTTALVETLKATDKYDSVALDKALKAFKADAYAKAIASPAVEVAALSTSSAEIKACAKADMETFDKERVKYVLSLLVDSDTYTIGFTPAYNATTFTGSDAVYYAKEWADVEAAFAAADAAIDAAVLTTDVTAAYKALNNALYAIKTSAAVDTAVSADSAMQTALTYAAAEVKAYYDSIVAGKNADDVVATKLYNADAATMLANIKAEIVSEGARTASDVATVASAVKADMAATPTVGEMTAKRKEVEALIAALPGTLKLTFADKAQVQAAYDALAAYNDAKAETTVTNTVANTAILDAVVDKMAELEYAEVVKAFKTIKNNTAATVTIADKETVLAAKEVFDALGVGRETVAEDGADGMYTWSSASIATTYDTLLAGANTAGSLYNAIRALELAAVEDAIDGLDAESTPAEIAAAKALYDAFVAEYTTVAGNYNAADKVDDAAKLEALVDANKMTDKAAKAYVQDLSIKARSEKTSKGVKITVKADVQSLLDAGYTVEYRFYRSTKSNKNFGKPMIVKSTNTYTNTKGVKGTKYYYKAKLVVKNAAGEEVATTPLTQCLYATRVF